MDAIKGSKLRVLKFLYPTTYNNQRKVGDVKSKVYTIHIAPYDKGSIYNDDINWLTKEGYITIDDRNINLTLKGLLYIENLRKDEKQFILNDIFYDFDYALLNYLAKRNEYVQLNDFPEILIELAPHVPTRINQGNLIESLFRLNKFIEDEGSWYSLNLIGYDYLYYIKRLRNNKEIKEGLEIKQIETAIKTNDSVLKLNTKTDANIDIQKRLTIAAVIVAAASLIVSMITAYQSFNEKTELRLQQIDSTLQMQQQRLLPPLQRIDTSLQNAVKKGTEKTADSPSAAQANK